MQYPHPWVQNFEIFFYFYDVNIQNSSSIHLSSKMTKKIFFDKNFKMIIHTPITAHEGCISLPSAQMELPPKDI